MYEQLYLNFKIYVCLFYKLCMKTYTQYNRYAKIRDRFNNNIIIIDSDTGDLHFLVPNFIPILNHS